MITQLVDATTDAAQIHPQLADHQAEMIRRCPYLGPSVHKGLTIWSAYSVEPSDHHDLLRLLVTYAERLRHDRKTHGPLVCRNIAIHGPQDPQEAQQLMDWPAWLARNLYAQVQIIIDRFWIGLGRKPGSGQSVMLPPAVSFFMVRNAIAHRDRLILSPRPAIELSWLGNGPGDDGRDVFQTTLGRPATEPKADWDELSQRFPTPIRSRP